MPELPDLEAYAGNLNKMVAGSQVIEVVQYNSKKDALANINTDVLISSRIEKFERDGKKMLIHFNNGNTISIHLMLEGKFHVADDINSVSFKIFDFNLNGRHLVITDPKGWAKMELNPAQEKVPDALSPDFSFAYLTKMLKAKKSKNIKTFLIDQNIVRGIGNAYVDEILWEANISPESKAGKIPEETAKQLYQSIGIVLRRSIDEILQAKPDIINGEVRDFMRVHNKRKKICPHGYPIKTTRISSKITYYTDEQIVY